jgi:anti-sigma B factor antagonist
MNKLRIVRRQSGEVLVVALRGQLDAMTTDNFYSVINEIRKSDVVYVVLDLKDVSLVDSSGIGAMVSLLKHTRSKDGDTMVAHLNQQPKEVYKILNLDEAIKVCDTVEQAVAMLAPNSEVKDSKAVGS